MFSWMLSHGAIFYFLIIKVEMKEKLKPKMKWFYALGWGKTKRSRLTPYKVDKDKLPLEILKYKRFERKKFV